MTVYESFVTVEMSSPNHFLMKYLNMKRQIKHPNYLLCLGYAGGRGGDVLGGRQLPQPPEVTQPLTFTPLGSAVLEPDLNRLGKIKYHVLAMHTQANR